MKIKHGLVALVAAGSTAAMVFGGSAVSTAFTSEQNGTATVGADTVGLTVTNGTFTESGLVPGQTAWPSEVVTADTGNSSTPTDLYLIPGAVSSTKGSDGLNPNLSDLTVQFVIDGTTESFNVGTLVANNAPVLLASNLPGHDALAATVHFLLSSSAGNDWNGATVTLPYTLHLQNSAFTNGFTASSDS